MRQPIYSPFKKPFFRNFKIQVKILKEPESKVFILDEDYFVDRLYRIIVIKEEKTEYDFIRLLIGLFEKNEIRIEGKKNYIITKYSTASDSTKINDLVNYKTFVNSLMLFLEDKYMTRLEEEEKRTQTLPF